MSKTTEGSMQELECPACGEVGFRSMWEWGWVGLKDERDAECSKCGAICVVGVKTISWTEAKVKQ